MSYCAIVDPNPRQEWLKRRFSGIIQKSQKALEQASAINKHAGSSSSHQYSISPCPRSCKDRMRARRKEMELRRKAEIQKRREAARREIEEMRNTAGICDPQQVMRDFEKLIGNKVQINQHMNEVVKEGKKGGITDCCGHNQKGDDEPEEGEITD